MKAVLIDVRVVEAALVLCGSLSWVYAKCDRERQRIVH